MKNNSGKANKESVSKMTDTEDTHPAQHETKTTD